MHSFVVVSSKPGRSIPQHVVDHLGRSDSPDLLFVPSDHLFWTDDARRVAFAGWQTVTAIGEVGSHWHTDERGLTAFAGRMWPRGDMWRRGPSWAEQLASHWRTHPMVDTQQPLGGIHAAVSITRSGSGTIVTDPLSVAMIYRAETDDVVVFSTSVRLAAHVAAAPGTEPERDAAGVAWLPLLGWTVGERTGFTSTRVLPLGAYVEIGPAFGSRVRFADATPWASDLPANEAELVELVHEDLTASVRSVAEMPAPRRAADITGGKDSRLVLALLLQEGLADRFVFNTWGDESSPDASVSDRIATRFQLARNPPAQGALGEAEFSRRLATHAFQTSGMSNAWEAKVGLRPSPRLVVTGCVGEAMRTHFHGYPEMSTAEQFRQQFHKRWGLRGASLVRRDVRAELLDRLDHELVQRVDAGGSSPQDLADSFYWRHRNRRWFGTYEELGESGRVHPLYSLAGLQAAFALGGRRRRLEALHFAVLDRACPDLAKMPFANDSWSEELISDRADADDYRAAAVRPRVKAMDMERWMPTRLLDNLDLARSLLLDDDTGSLHDIVDRRAVERVLAEPERATITTCRQLFGALTAAVWLGRHESPQRIGEEPVPVRFRTKAREVAAGPATTAERRQARRTLMRQNRVIRVAARASRPARRAVRRLDRTRRG